MSDARSQDAGRDAAGSEHRPPAAEVAAWLAHLVDPDQVTELRALNVPPSGQAGEAPRTWVGEFRGTPADLEAMAAAAVDLSDRGASGVYLTPNPLRRPDGPRRQMPRVMESDHWCKPARDADVLARRWLVVDVDPVRPGECSGQSANDGEKAAAWAVAERVREHLAAECGGVEPVLADSGNGYHLLYRLSEDVPVDPERLPLPASDPMRLLLHELADRFDTAAAKVDRGVYNPGRIVKLPGTVGRKGTHAADRPHRRARLLATPATPLRLAWGDVLRLARPAADRLAAERAEYAARAARDAAEAGSASSPGRRRHAATETRVAKYVAATPGAVSGKRGSDRTLELCSRLVWGFCLTPERARPYVLEWNARCVPPWDVRDLERKLGQILALDHDKPFGHLLNAPPKVRPGHGARGGGGRTYEPPPDDGGRTSAPPPGGGSASPAGSGAAAAGPAEPAGRPGGLYGVDLLDPQALRATYLAKYRYEGDGVDYRLMYQGGSFRAWACGAWREWTPDEADRSIRKHAEAEARTDHAEKLKDYEERMRQSDGESKERPPKQQFVTDPVVRGAMGSIRAEVLQDAAVAAPCWLTPRRDRPDPRWVIPTTSGVIDPATGELLPATPELFVTHAAPHRLEDAPPPAAWLAYLDRLFVHDADRVGALQEFFGLCLIQDVSFQKACLIVGDSNSGKGVVSDVLQWLVGPANYAGMTYDKLGGQFALSGLANKAAAVVDDFRVGRDGGSASLAAFLSVVGGGVVPIDRKNRDPVSGRVSARLLLLSNEMPRVRDDTPTAVTRRLLVLPAGGGLAEGAADRLFAERLRAELPGIFAWAVAGAGRLLARGRFVQPRAGLSALDDLRAAASDVGVFAEGDLAADPAAWTPTADVYAAWVAYCAGNNVKSEDRIGTAAHLGGRLKTVFRDIVRVQRRVNGVQRVGYAGVRFATEQDRPDPSPASPDGHRQDGGGGDAAAPANRGTSGDGHRCHHASSPTLFREEVEADRPTHDTFHMGATGTGSVTGDGGDTPTPECPVNPFPPDTNDPDPPGPEPADNPDAPTSQPRPTCAASATAARTRRRSAPDDGSPRTRGGAA